MATLILGTVGRAIGGPIGGIVGGLLGSTLDRAIGIGGGGRREGARLGNLSVQSSAYGEPLPRIYGRMRVAGNLVWTAGIAERQSTSGGGKRGGARTTSYSYSASFAVVLSARRIEGIARIWADGKLLRDAAGNWLQPATMRLHDGSEGQAADPLIAGAEGIAATPAYRGLAYVVFEDLELAEYGNRIPNLTFEVIADAATDAGAVAGDLGAAAGVALTADGAFASLGGFSAARAGDLRAQLTTLAEVFDLRFIDDGTGIEVRAGPAPGIVALSAGDLGSVAANARRDTARRELRGAAGLLDDAVAIGFYDASRDYQPGLQRAVRRGGGRVLQLDVPMAFAADVAKGLAADMLARQSTARTSATLQLPPRALTLRAGMQVLRPGDAVSWAVRSWTFSDFTVELAVERQPLRALGVQAADPGRVHDSGDGPAGATVLHLLDLPTLFGTLPVTPRLWVAGAGSAPGWRRSGVALSTDEGHSYAAVGEIAGPSAMGTLAAPLGAGCGDRWDRLGAIDVLLLNDAMWLDSRSESAVLAGGNLAAVGDEVVQFAEAVPLGAGRFRLSGLLRGRRGSAVAAHPAGTRFVMLDAGQLLPVDVAAEAVGQTLLLRATGSGDLTTAPVALSFTGRALRPLSPVFIRHAAAGGDAVFGWIRRSRAGFTWPDAVDAPLGEAREAYRVELSVAGSVVRHVDVTAPAWSYPAALRLADGTLAGTTVTLAVAQLSDLAGLGDVARTTFVLR